MTGMQKRSLISVLVLGLLVSSWSKAEEVRTCSETLSEAEAKSKKNSGTLKASEAMVEAAQSQSIASRAPLFPRLTFDATYFYQTQIPTLSMGTILGTGAGPQIQFGSNSNYSVGPNLTYVLFDAGQARKNWKSSESHAEARGEDRKTTERQLELNTRTAYFRVQYSLKELLLTANSLKLSQAQDRDIGNRFKAGAASRLDKINSQQGVLNYQLRYRQAQTSLSASIRQLLALTGEASLYDSSRPIPSELADSLPADVEPPTLKVRLDQLEKTVEVLGLGQAQLLQPDGQHPQIRSLELSAQASRLSSEAQSSGLWPKVQVAARVGYIYPNGPVLENTQQNVFTVNLSMPLFEADQTRSVADARMREAMMADSQKEQKLSDLDRDWHIARDQLESLHLQQKLADQNVSAAEEAGQLTYKSYQAGKVNYLDVQSANQRLLQAEVNAAQIQANTLIQIAQLEFLSSATQRSRDHER